MNPKYTNALINETSPYLLQHAHNPVNWEAWSPETLEKAKEKNTLLLISIGYAACHWCHVMEHECFEDPEVAETMNANFVNIKIDREERPDIDHIYMDALQMMTGSGGWPLNIVALPDGRPFWGATYVKKEDWIKVLGQLSNLYKEDPAKIEAYAKDMAQGIKAMNLVEPNTGSKIIEIAALNDAVKNWSRYFDTYLGGYKRAPKFMMPTNLNFLLHYGTAQKDKEVLEYVHTTLTKMAWGGIFDHLGGGFSRYSVDTKWHVPHFEKMLYDNGQLVSLYAQAYAATKNDLYKHVVDETIRFVKEELTDESHGFYSSLDADSIDDKGALEEGAYYVWKKEVLESVLGVHWPIFKDFFNINRYGHWEHGNYVLIRDASKEEIAKKHSVTIQELDSTISQSVIILTEERNKRNAPRLDDKILTSWNGLMLKGLVDAYRYLGNETYLDLALKNAAFIEENMVRPDGGLFHNHKKGKSTLNGYLEDYATVIEAYIGLFELSFDEAWLFRAKALTNYCITHFSDPTSGLFYFTNTQDDYVIRRTLEVSDNVVPASNSIMAKNLYRLSRLFPREKYGQLAEQMLRNVQGNFSEQAQNHANWMQLALYMNQPFYEIGVVGSTYQDTSLKIGAAYLPNVLIAGTEKEGTLGMLKNRFQEEETLIYVCMEGVCKLPLHKPVEALEHVQF